MQFIALAWSEKQVHSQTLHNLKTAFTNKITDKNRLMVLSAQKQLVIKTAN